MSGAATTPEQGDLMLLGGAGEAPMRVRPIAFGPAMVAALRAGRKTVTRRMLHPQPDAVNRVGIRQADGTMDFAGTSVPWAPGDRLYVKRDPALHLLVHHVKVERLQAITKRECASEGLVRVSKDGRLWKWGLPDRDGFPGTDDHGWPWQAWEADPRRAFARLWDSLHGWGAWDSNPWVAAISFTIEPAPGLPGASSTHTGDAP